MTPLGEFLAKTDRNFGTHHEVLEDVSLGGHEVLWVRRGQKTELYCACILNSKNLLRPEEECLYFRFALSLRRQELHQEFGLIVSPDMVERVGAAIARLNRRSAEGRFIGQSDGRAGLQPAALAEILGLDEPVLMRCVADLAGQGQLRYRHGGSFRVEPVIQTQLV